MSDVDPVTRSGSLETVNGDDPIEEDYQHRLFLDRQGHVEPGDHTWINLGGDDDGGDPDA